MTRINQLLFAYMAAVGLAAGTGLVLAPQIQDFWIKPFFWILIALLIFDIGAHLVAQAAPGSLLTMPARLIALGIGIVAMMAIPAVAGVPIRFV